MLNKRQRPVISPNQLTIDNLPFNNCAHLPETYNPSLGAINTLRLSVPGHEYSTKIASLISALQDVTSQVLEKIEIPGAPGSKTGTFGFTLLRWAEHESQRAARHHCRRPSSCHAPAILWFRAPIRLLLAFIATPASPPNPSLFFPQILPRHRRCSGHLRPPFVDSSHQHLPSLVLHPSTSSFEPFPCRNRFPMSATA